MSEDAERDLPPAATAESEDSAEDAAEADREIGQILRQRLIAARFITRSGPLPDPATLAEYERILPGSAERIFRTFEKQFDHRMAIESVVIASNSFSQKLGTVFGGLVGLTGVAGGLWLSYAGRSLQGFAILVGTIGSLVGVYVSQGRSERLNAAVRAQQGKADKDVADRAKRP